MFIQTENGDFLIEKDLDKPDYVRIKTNSREELERFFGSVEITFTNRKEYPYQIFACKQEIANALILMLKEIEYSDFDVQELIS